MKTEELCAARNRTLAALAMLAFLGCNPSKSVNDEEDAGPFVAYSSTFQEYRNWRHSPASATDAPSGPHTNGSATVYWNDLPPRGSADFPIGTMLVEETDPGVTPAQVFAMVKRGGGFNSSGAVDWEWFGLQTSSSGSVTIIWRGVDPPSGEGNGGDSNTCNTCHRKAVENDFVWSDALQLSSL